MLDPALRREFRRLALINVLSNLTVPLAGLADTAMLGRQPGAIDLAGVALAGLLFDLLYFGLGFLRMGTTGPVAQAHGRGDDRAQAELLARGGALAVVLGLLVVAASRPLEHLTFSLLSGTALVEQAGAEYLRARIWAAPATLLNMVLLGWFLGRSQSGRALMVTAVANAVNILGNALFILALGMGAAGAGLATALGQVCGSIVALALLRGQIAGGLRLERLRDRRALITMFSLQRDIFVRTICLLVAFTLFTELSARLGTVVLAANAVLLRVVSVGSYWIDGLAYATETLVGRLHGAGDPRARHQLLRWAASAGLGSALAIALPTALAPDLLLGWLIEEQSVRALLATIAPWLVPVLGLGSVAYVLDGYFLGLSAGRRLRDSMLLSLAGFLPVALAGWRLDSVHGLWLAMTVLMAARALTLGLPAWRKGPAARTS